MERAFGDPEMLKKICSLPLNSFLECLEIIARSNYNEKDRTIVSALETYKNISPHACVSFLSSFNLTEATFHYLGSLISRDLLDSELTFKYIEIACSLSRFEDAANMCDKSQNINCGQVKDFLKSAGGKCYIPLIHICDRFNLVEELIIYLYQRSEIEIIEYYVKQHNPARTPEVVGHLMKLDCDNKLLDKLISLSDGKFSVDEMIGVCESNDNLPLIHEYLQSQAQKGNRSESLYTALAKIHIEKNAAPEKFLEENSYYNVKVVGDYCRSINPVLALICYKKGNFVDEVISLTNQNAMFRAQVEYLLPLSDQKVWESVISPSNPYRDHIIDQLVKGNIVGNYEQVHASNLVKASMNVARPQELLELLETLVKNPKFKSSRNLRNLLILAAMKIDRTLVKKYLDEVEDFDAVDIANTATSKGYYDEAYRIYSKAGLYNEAIEVAIKHMGDMECAAELAEKVNTKDIWRKFAKGWLDSGNIDACMSMFYAIYAYSRN